MSDDRIAEIRARHEDNASIGSIIHGPDHPPRWTLVGWKAHHDRAFLLLELDRVSAENERLRAERDALRNAAHEYLTTLGAAMKAGKFQMGGSAEMAHFVRSAMQKLDSLVFDRAGPRPAGLERLHEPFKKPS